MKTGKKNDVQNHLHVLSNLFPVLQYFLKRLHAKNISERGRGQEPG
jgi:hypothetical protein